MPPTPEKPKHIRNFSIVAHVDHGKSTLADRLLQATNAVTAREAREQILDSMDIERERGITIKASAVTVLHRHKPGAVTDDVESDYEAPVSDSGEHTTTKGHAEDHGELYMLNFIDTPGHVDFNYEVSRALKACEGAILVVDATQGVQAQTVVNAYLAINENLKIIPVINKIDLPSARPEYAAAEMEQIIGIPASEAIFVSAKTGQGIPELLAAICDRFPGPRASVMPQTRALIFDAVYDDHRGVMVYFRIMDGSLKVGDKIRMVGTQRSFTITDIIKYIPKPTRVLGPDGKPAALHAGETGALVAAIRTLADVRVGDTITLDTDPAKEPLEGYQPPTQMVFCDFYPSTSEDGEESTDFEDLREAINKLSLNDAAFTFAPVHSEALGFGFRCGFLGLLHMDIIQERLEREGHVEVVQTAPTVSYRVLCRGEEPPKPKDATGGRTAYTICGTEDGNVVIEVHNPADLPNLSNVVEIREPMCKVDIMLPKEHIGAVMKLCLDRRGEYKAQQFVSDSRDMLTFELPLAEIIYDFFDKLKGMTQGYGTMQYEVTRYKTDDLVKLDILVNGDPVEALAVITHRLKAEQRGRSLIARLKEQIPKHQFEIPLQAAIGSKVIARETIKSFRKNVLAKCYGGDISRKKKLLDKQKEGKKRMKAMGQVMIPQEAFMAVLDQGE
jgi:GTP-binding protein LepA